MGLFNQGTESYKSDIKIGERYRDEQTGVEGIVTGIYFYQHGCERVAMETVKDGEIKEYSFDAPRLVHVPTATAVRAQRTGGPNKGGSRPSSPARR